MVAGSCFTGGPSQHERPRPTVAAFWGSIVSGRARGVVPTLVRSLLWLAEGPYALAMRVRNWQYDRDPERLSQACVPVICVGNITLGGTGKTPVVEWLARWFRAKNIRVTIVSRGYGAEQGSRNDEALELEERLLDVPHLQNADRVAAAAMAIEEFDCQLILLDDGFQHRRLVRDLDIVLIDAVEPFGYGHVFPRGMLREPLVGLKRAHVVMLSRANLVSVERRREIRTVVQRYAPQAAWAEVMHAPRELRNTAGDVFPLETLRGARVAACCGIGNPAGFRHTLESCGCEIVAWREFPDHHHYTRDDVESLEHWAKQSGVDRVICTHKDLVKLRVATLGGIPLAALVIGIEVISGMDEIEGRLEAIAVRSERAGDDSCE